MERVLVVSASMGAGHDGAAKELCRRLEERGCETKMVDWLDAPLFHLGPLVRVAYELQLRLAPWLYEATYRLWYLGPFLVVPLVGFINLMTRTRVRRWARTFGADAIVSTYPLASMGLGRDRRKGRITVPTATFCTDFAIHPLWVHKGIDVHLCVSPPSAEAARQRTGGHRAEAPGPLVPDRFFHGLPEREAARAQFGIAPDERVALVVAGSWGVGDVTATFDALLASGRYTPLAVCARNEHLKAELETRGGGIVLGWTDQMPALMAACDVLVQNAGGLTCMEAFAAGLPVVSYNVIPGHGRENAKLMDEAGVAAFVETPDDLVPILDRVTTLAGHGMVKAAQALFQADAADTIVELIAANAPAAARTPVRVPRRRVRNAVAVAAVSMAAYVGVTGGVGIAAANGVGVARAPKQETTARTVYLAVRLGPATIDDPALPAVLRADHATAVVDASTAAAHPGAITRLRASGVEIANGGMGTHARYPGARANADLLRASKLLRTSVGTAPLTFIPGRRIDGFDLASAHVVHERVVVPNEVVEPGENAAPRVEARRIYLVDGREASAADVVALLTSMADEFHRSGLTVLPISDLK